MSDDAQFMADHALMEVIRKRMVKGGWDTDAEVQAFNAVTREHFDALFGEIEDMRTLHQERLNAVMLVFLDNLAELGKRLESLDPLS